MSASEQHNTYAILFQMAEGEGVRCVKEVHVVSSCVSMCVSVCVSERAS